VRERERETEIQESGCDWSEIGRQHGCTVSGIPISNHHTQANKTLHTGRFEVYDSLEPLLGQFELVQVVVAQCQTQANTWLTQKHFAFSTDSVGCIADVCVCARTYRAGRVSFKRLFVTTQRFAKPLIRIVNTRLAQQSGSVLWVHIERCFEALQERGLRHAHYAKRERHK
jgi:hypothetical protein